MDHNYKILSKVDSPNDMKGLSYEELKLLADEISDYIHKVIFISI